MPNLFGLFASTLLAIAAYIASDSVLIGLLVFGGVEIMVITFAMMLFTITNNQIRIYRELLNVKRLP